MIRAIIFDLDGTLVEINIDFCAMRNDLKKIFEKYDLEFHNEKLILENIEHARMIMNDENFMRDVNNIVEKYEFESIKEKKKIDGVEEKLYELKNRNIKIFVLTRSGRKYCNEVISFFSENIFDEIITRDDFPTIKPDTGPIIYLMKKYNLKKNEILMVGDHPIDIETAKKIGIKCVGVLSGCCDRKMLEEAGANVILESAAELSLSE